QHLRPLPSAAAVLVASAAGPLHVALGPSVPHDAARVLPHARRVGPAAEGVAIRATHDFLGPCVVAVAITIAGAIAVAGAVVTAAHALAVLRALPQRPADLSLRPAAVHHGLRVLPQTRAIGLAAQDV